MKRAMEDRRSSKGEPLEPDNDFDGYGGSPKAEAKGSLRDDDEDNYKGGGGDKSESGGYAGSKDSGDDSPRDYK